MPKDERDWLNHPLYREVEPPVTWPAWIWGLAIWAGLASVFMALVWAGG